MGQEARRFYRLKSTGQGRDKQKIYDWLRPQSPHCLGEKAQS